MRWNVFSFLGVLAVWLCAGGPVAFAASLDIKGYWYTQDREGGIELYPCDDTPDSKICGRFRWLQKTEASDDLRDRLNPDPSKRDESLCHMQFMGNFTSDGKGHYTEGWVYSPRHGQVFNADITVLDKDTLDLHGYLWLPSLGDSQIWKRADSLPECSSTG